MQRHLSQSQVSKTVPVINIEVHFSVLYRFIAASCHYGSGNELENRRREIAFSYNQSFRFFFSLYTAADRSRWQIRKNKTQTNLHINDCFLPTIGNGTVYFIRSKTQWFSRCWHQGLYMRWQFSLKLTYIFYEATFIPN